MKTAKTWYTVEDLDGNMLCGRSGIEIEPDAEAFARRKADEDPTRVVRLVRHVRTVESQTWMTFNRK